MKFGPYTHVVSVNCIQSHQIPTRDKHPQKSLILDDPNLGMNTTRPSDHIRINRLVVFSIFLCVRFCQVLDDTIVLFSSKGLFTLRTFDLKAGDGCLEVRIEVEITTDIDWDFSREGFGWECQFGSDGKVFEQFFLTDEEGEDEAGLHGGFVEDGTEGDGISRVRRFESSGCTSEEDSWSGVEDGLAGSEA